ncbi:hypothetical protein MRX96_021508 [Rhipicephalus microplus]
MDKLLSIVRSFATSELGSRGEGCRRHRAFVVMCTPSFQVASAGTVARPPLRQHAQRAPLCQSFLFARKHSGNLHSTSIWAEAAHRISGSIWIAVVRTREAFYDLVYDHSKQHSSSVLFVRPSLRLAAVRK